MNIEINISEITGAFAQQISAWKYDGVYSVYNHDEEFINSCMDGMHHAYTDAAGELLGYMCFGTEARIPTIEKNVYDNGFLDIGLHIRPDLTGKKLGSSFLSACLDYAKKNHNTDHFRATIASFNERAINLCLRAGFYREQEVTHVSGNRKFTIVKRKPSKN